MFGLGMRRQSGPFVGLPGLTGARFIKPVSDGRRARRFMRGAVTIAAAGSVALTAALPANAQGIPLIRDTEIEELLNDYASPIFKAAGFGSGRVAMRIVNSDTFNAFVVDGRNVFVNTGTLQISTTPNQVIGVIAHEAGHIAGGHMAALRSSVARSQSTNLLMQILGIGLMVAGGVAGGDTGREIGGAGTGVLYGGSELVMRGLLSERRSQESAADQAGLKYLNSTKQSGRGMLETFERFRDQEYLTDTHRDPFVRSHPVATDRLNQLRRLVEQSPYYNNVDPPELQFRHDLMRAKLIAYINSQRPQVVFNTYPDRDTSEPARYARAIARFFQGGQGAVERSLREIDALIEARPQYPYYRELKGDILKRGGRFAEAVPYFRQALKLVGGDASLMQVELATALYYSGDKSKLGEVVKLLRASLVQDKNPQAYNVLANAYGAQGREPEALAASAQQSFLMGNLQDAQIKAKRAQRGLKTGSPLWIQVDDIINYKPPT